MIKHYICPKCKKQTSAEDNIISTCKCTGARLMRTQMIEKSKKEAESK